MAGRRRRGSIRLWQTELFIAVIVVAILILSGSLSAGLSSTLALMAETSEIRNASALAQRLSPEFPLAADGLGRVREVVTEYRDIYGSGIWIFDAEGTLLESAYDAAPLDAQIESARLGGLDATSSYAASDLRANGWVIASKAITDDRGEPLAVVVTASTADSSVAILRAVRDRLWVTFWVSLVVAGLLGFGFSELISRRIRAMTEAAAAMAAGDFEQRLPTGLIPDEIQFLAESYNTMAAKLGEAFGEIQESRRRVAAVIESMAEGVLALDENGVITVANPEAARLLGSDSVMLVGKRAEEVTSVPGVLDIVSTGLSGVSAAGTVSLGARTVLLHCTPLLDADERIEGTVVLLADVTEQRRLEDAQRRFVADASHEMRTPIAALKGILELLADGAKDVPEVRDDFIATMQVEVDRLGRLVSDLLTLAQLESGGLKLSSAALFTTDLLGDVARVLHPLAEQAEVTLAVTIDDPDTRVMADHDKIVQVLLGFTDNALKHSPRGSTVRLAATHAAPGRVRLSVTDEGPGIAPEEVSRVFERFYQADGARAGGGTGLGLAIAKEVVEAHGSTIAVESDPGSGTTFSFELPEASLTKP